VDYSSVFLTVNFAAGQTSAQVSVLTLNDPLTEPTETVGLFLSGGSVASPSAVLLRIIDTTPVPPAQFFYGSASAPIGEGGTGVVRINRTGNTSVSDTIDYLILDDGDLTYSQDYTITGTSVTVSDISGGTVSFGPGVTSVSLTIQDTSALTGDVLFGLRSSTGFLGNPPSTQITLL
jgi:hypothetical protein